MPGPLRTFAREIPVTSGIKPVRLDYLLAVAAVRRIVRVFTNRLNIIHFINNHIHLYKLSYQFKAWAVLGALMLGFAGLFAAYYPPISGIEDETGFLNQAIVWSRGAVSSEGAGFPCGLHDFIELKGRHVPARHPGRSLLALPLLVLGGTRATFVSGLALHLLATLAGAALLVRLGRSPLWAVLILFHPTLAVYSRTVLADGAAGAGLLLAALGVASGAPVFAGLAVGLAATMRYYSALALPLVAGSFVLPRVGTGAKPWRDAAICLLAGGAAGCMLVGYNLAVYGTPNEPFTMNRGYFSAACVVPNATFYATALLVLWPGMLFAPLLDRSRLRWVVRGVIVLFLGPLLFYYFHDVAPGWLETSVVGLRLLQVALPLWVVSYAGVIDDWVAAPVRRRLRGREWRWLVAFVCVGLLVANGLVFARHQRHLDALRRARDAVVASVPGGSLVMYQGALAKIVGTPLGVPEYRLRALEFEGKPADDPAFLYCDLDRELHARRRAWYFANLQRRPGDPVPLTEYARELVERYRMERIPVESPLLSLYVARPEPVATP